MKTMYKLVAVLLLIVLLASCASTVSDELYERYTHPTDYYPRYAEPYSEFVVDAEGNWSFETGRFLTKEEIANYDAGPLTEDDLFVEQPETKMLPNTKVNYDLHGFIVDVMYFYDGAYHLAPQSATGE